MEWGRPGRMEFSPSEWPSPEDAGEHTTAPQLPKPQKTHRVPHCESIFQGVPQKWSGLSGASIHSSHPGRPLPPGQTLSTLTASVTTEMWEAGKAGGAGQEADSRKYPHPLAPYPGLHQLRPLGKAGPGMPPGARVAVPRLGLRGEWSRPRGQSWHGERLPAPQGGGRSLPASHATMAACRCDRECQGRAGRREVCPGKVGEEPWTGHREQPEAWDGGHGLPVWLPCGGTPGHVPLWALLLHLPPQRVA